MKNATLVHLLGLLLALNIPCYAQLDTAQLTQELTIQFAASELPGLAVALVSAEGLLYTQTFGYADKVQEIPFQTNTCLPVGSVTKTLTGMAVVRLVEMGGIAWDDPINDYLSSPIVNPYSPDDPIRVYHLLNHTSTLLDGKFYGQSYLLDTDFDLTTASELHGGYLEFIQDHATLSLAEFIREAMVPKGRWYKKKNFLKAKPGEQQEYSNINAAVAGLLVEEASGIPFQEFVQEQLFEPMELTNSSCARAGEYRACRASLYFPSGYQVPPYRLATYPDGGWIASVDDLSKYVQDAIRGYSGLSGVLEAGSYKMMLPGDEDERRAFWGMGRTSRNIGHTGSDPGIHCDIQFNADHPIGIIMLTNVNAEDNETLWEQYRAMQEIMQTHAQQVDLGED